MTRSGVWSCAYDPRCISCVNQTEAIRNELRRELRTRLGDRVYFSAYAPAPQGWLMPARVRELLHALITASANQLQLEAVGTEAQGWRAEAERLRQRAKALHALRLAQWHLPEVQQELWRLVWRDTL